jgi:hypothetical protein
MLYPGNTIVIENVPVPDLWDMGQPGRYTIRVRRPDGLGSGGMIVSNTIEVTITPL